jgi:Helix-turn-helix domain
MHKVVELYPRLGKAKHPPQDLPRHLQDLKDQLKAEIIAALKHMLRGPGGGRLKKWLSPKQVQAKLNLSASTLRRLRQTGNLPYVKFDGRVYYDPADVDLEMRTRKMPRRR